MNSDHKSVGTIFPIGIETRWALAIFPILVCLLAGFFGCSSAEKPLPPWAPPFEEVSIYEDQKSIADLRKNIPKEKRLENDELKEILILMGQIKDPPAKVYSRFQKILRKRRTKHKKWMRKTRNKFTKSERKSREKFLKKIKKDRKRFLKNKVEREERREFFNKQDEKRKEFFAESKDRRKEFESVMRQKSKDFDSEIRERTREFNQEYRLYSLRYREAKVEEVRRKRQLWEREQSPKPESEFDGMSKLPGTPLETGKDKEEDK